MPKRTLLPILGLFLFLSSCNPAEESDAGESARSPDYANLELPDRPNILWIVAEDLGPYLPMFGDSTVETPHLSRLAREGVVYTHFFSPSGVCAPSRAAIATGMYPTRIGANHMRTGPWYRFDVPEEVIRNYPTPVYEAMPPAGTHMMSTYLREAGYYCSNNAKEDYQFRRELTAWDESSNQGHWRDREAGQPFFSIFNLEVTHESRIWALAEDSLWVDPDLDVPVKPYLPDTEIARQDIRRMYSNIKIMDRQVGEILAQLEADGLLEETVIFWYADHGGPLPRQKRLLFDSGLRSPLIVRFPDQQLAGKLDSQLLNFIDLKPTVLSLAGLEPPAYVDGKAWLGPYAEEEERDYVFAAADRFDEKTDRRRAVRDHRYKLIRNYMPEKPNYLAVTYREQMPIMQELLRLRDAGQLNAIQSQWFRTTKDSIELFDTWSDPDEVNNLAGDLSYQGEVEELKAALDQWIAETGDVNILDEDKYLASIWPEGEQPITRMPSITRTDNRIQLQSATPGATIGYQWALSREQLTDRWRVYTTPFSWKADSLFTRADRIGYLPSNLVGYGSQ